MQIKDFSIKKIGQKDIEIDLSVGFDSSVDLKKYFKSHSKCDWTWEKHLTLDIEYVGKYYRSLQSKDPAKPMTPPFYDEQLIKIAAKVF